MYDVSKGSVIPSLVVAILLIFAGTDIFACNMQLENCMPGPGRMAFVWANNPQATHYTPDETYTQNDAPVTISRLRTGVYQVMLGEIEANDGNVQISTVGDNTHCQVSDWQHGNVNVACFGVDARPVDSRFLLLYLQGGPQSYVLAYRKNGKSYRPLGKTAHWDRAVQAPLISRSEVGTYRVLLHSSGGNAQVTAYGDQPAYCNVMRWSKRQVDVKCFDLKNHQPTDTQFTLLVSGPSLRGTYFLANMPSKPEYVPDPRYSFAQDDIKVMRQSPGRYRVLLQDPVLREGGNLQVTAYGGDARCMINEWQGENILVTCYHGSEAVNSQFSLLFNASDPRM